MTGNSFKIHSLRVHHKPSKQARSYGASRNSKECQTPPESRRRAPSFQAGRPTQTTPTNASRGNAPSPAPSRPAGTAQPRSHALALLRLRPLGLRLGTEIAQAPSGNAVSAFPVLFAGAGLSRACFRVEGFASGEREG